MVKTKQKSRGIPVWGSRLKELRKRRGWTQQELASHSGYCERLVRKAELNGTVSEETLEVLAITLSDSHQRISIDDLSLSSRTTAIALDEAIFSPAQSTLENLVLHAHPQITIDCSIVDSRLPLSGIFRRQRGLVDWYTVLVCLVKMESIVIKERVLLDNARFGYIHASVDCRLQPAVITQFDIDIRVHFRKSLIHQIVWLSSLDSLIPIAFEWEQMVKSQYQQQITKICQIEHAQHSS